MSDVREQSGDEALEVTLTDQASSPEDNPERSYSETRVRSGGSRADIESELSTAAPLEAEGAGSANPNSAEPDVEADPPTDDADDDPENTLEGEAEIAADYLEELLDIADLDGDIDTYIEGDRAHVSIVSESTVLVGGHGEVLDALQELTRLAVMTETGERSRLMLDVAGFRDRRREQLIALAGRAVEQARSSQQPVPLEPMNPFERKIVHDAVAAAGLSSESEGDEPKRHVVVQPQA